MSSFPPLVWIDMEMSGLDPRKDVVLEIATLITDGDLNVIAEGPEIVVSQPEEVLEGMNDWCKEHHGASGLTRACLQSDISLKQAEQLTLDFIRKHCDAGKSPLCGNSIGQDKAFLQQHMPDITNYLHYRVIDVSTIKELGKRWYGETLEYKKANGHRALDDIRESIAELRYYRETVFRSQLS